VNSGGASVVTAERSVILPIEGSNGVCPNIFCLDNGSVGIGTSTVPVGFKVGVGGKVIAEGVKVELQGNWPDYVFEEGYQLRDLKSLKQFITTNGHLPNIPDAATIEKEGMDVEEINVKLIEKIEELSLYLIQMEERIKALEVENAKLRKNNQTSDKQIRK
jgi:hypothetical protein